MRGKRKSRVETMVMTQKATHLVEEGCIGDHHGNLTGGIEAVQPPPVSEMVEATGPTDHSSTILSPHPVCVCVCVCVCVMILVYCCANGRLLT